MFNMNGIPGSSRLISSISNNAQRIVSNTGAVANGKATLGSDFFSVSNAALAQKTHHSSGVNSAVSRSLSNVVSRLERALSSLETLYDGWTDAKKMAMSVRDNINSFSNADVASLDLAFQAKAAALTSIATENTPGSTSQTVLPNGNFPLIYSSSTDTIAFTVSASDAEASSGSVSGLTIADPATPNPTNNQAVATATVNSIQSYLGLIMQDQVKLEATVETITNQMNLAAMRSGEFGNEALEYEDIDPATGAAQVALEELQYQEGNAMLAKLLNMMRGSARTLLGV